MFSIYWRGYFQRKSSDRNDSVRGRHGDLAVSCKAERALFFFRSLVSLGGDEKGLSESSLRISCVQWPGEERSLTPRIRADDRVTPFTTLCHVAQKGVLPSASAYLGFEHVTSLLRFLPSLIPIAALKSVFVFPDHHGNQESC